MLPWICTGSHEAILNRQKNNMALCSLEWAFAVREENVITFKRPDLSNRVLAFIGYCIAVGIIARLHSWAVGLLLEKKVNIIIFFFLRQVYVHNQLYKCCLLITFENSSDPTKCSCDNACMCSLVSAGLIIIAVLNWILMSRNMF